MSHLSSSTHRLGPPVRRPNGRRPEGSDGDGHCGTLPPRKPRPGQRKRGNPSILNRVAERDQSYIIGSFLEQLGTPRALTVWLLYKYGEHRQLVGLTLDPTHYRECDRAAFRKDYAATKFLSKCTGLKTGIDLKQVALGAAEEAESHCSTTNRRIKMLRSGAVMHPLTSKWFEAKNKIAAILGPVPTSFPDVGWSSGRTSSAYGEIKSPIDKYRSRPDVTRDAYSRALRLLNSSPLWAASLLESDGACSILPSGKVIEVVTGNTLITVPKNAKTDRVICYEPHMNIRLQLAVGAFIRSRLKRVGVDLNDQSVNQRRARFASKTGKLATLDLSMASDTLSLELVYELLPLDWAMLLDDLRSKYTTWPDGSVRRNEKFSSMGNGFTFELESMIFYALACTVSSNVTVYGDDIIVAVEDFDAVCELLEFSGFKINRSKSFGTGLFRESCGCDVFHGLDVTPPFLRSLPRTYEDVIKIHNQVREWCSRDPVPEVRYARLLKTWRHLAPSLSGPSGYGEGHYHVNLDESKAIWNSSVGGWWFSSAVRSSRLLRLGIDRIVGSFPYSYGYAVLCVGTGPKRSRSAYDQLADRRESVISVRRVLASLHWPDVLWV